MEAESLSFLGYESVEADQFGSAALLFRLIWSSSDTCHPVSIKSHLLTTPRFLLSYLAFLPLRFLLLSFSVVYIPLADFSYHVHWNMHSETQSLGAGTHWTITADFVSSHGPLKCFFADTCALLEEECIFFLR
jgi:hypothetical protein